MELSFHHICIETDRYEESLRFYIGILGFELVEESREFHGRAFNAWLKNGEIIIELQTPKRGVASSDPSSGARGLRHVCFAVESLELLVEELEARGFDAFLEGRKLYEVKGNKLCKIASPEGTIIELRSK